MPRTITPWHTMIAAFALAGTAALAAPAAAAAAPAAPAATASKPAASKAASTIQQERNAKSADELARILKGRTAGTPVDCISLHRIRSSRIINNNSIVFTDIGGTKYVNTPTSGANFLQDGLTLVINTSIDQLCNVDVVRLVDTTTRMGAGSVGLGQFVPYPKPAKGK